MKIGPLLILTFIIAAIIFAISLFVGAGLMNHGKTSAGTETQNIEIEIPYVANETSNKTSETVNETKITVQENNCGDKQCEASERCDAATLTTGCFEDCGYLCPPKIILGTSPNSTKSVLNAFACNDSSCIRMGENDFLLHGKSAIKIYLINIGEQESSTMTANFFCADKADPLFRATRTGDEASGVLFQSYFTNQTQSAELRGKYKPNFAEFFMELSPESISDNGISFYCYITFLGEEPMQQIVNVKVTP